MCVCDRTKSGSLMENEKYDADQDGPHPDTVQNDKHAYVNEFFRLSRRLGI